MARERRFKKTKPGDPETWNDNILIVLFPRTRGDRPGRSAAARWNTGKTATRQYPRPAPRLRLTIDGCARMRPSALDQTHQQAQPVGPRHHRPTCLPLEDGRLSTALALGLGSWPSSSCCCVVGSAQLAAMCPLRRINGHAPLAVVETLGSGMQHHEKVVGGLAKARAHPSKSLCAPRGISPGP